MTIEESLKEIKDEWQGECTEIRRLVKVVEVLRDALTTAIGEYICMCYDEVTEPWGASRNPCRHCIAKKKKYEALEAAAKVLEGEE